ncbi:hypothetical protein KAR91_56895 [Candidatus Pacearchaeota archaeon]|nr:hypothetical protein [Candidatus Pacearchaeota archaeon]
MGEVRQNRKSIKTTESMNYKSRLGKYPRKTTAREDKKKTSKLKHEN